MVTTICLSLIKYTSIEMVAEGWLRLMNTARWMSNALPVCSGVLDEGGELESETVGRETSARCEAGPNLPVASPLKRPPAWSHGWSTT